MPTRPLDDSLALEAVNTLRELGGSVKAACELLDLSPSTFRHRLLVAAKRGIVAGKELPPVVDEAAEKAKEKLELVKKRNPLPAFISGDDLPTYYSRPDNTYLFGATSDNHLGSKYSRLDVLNDLYDRFERRGVDRVLNAGNWIDGEARFNMHDLLVHGMDGQCRYLAENYPQRKGLVTYAVSGDDHEGWYCQKTGVDIGAYAQDVMRRNGRNDWVDVGYMEAHFQLINSNSGAASILALVHPGGGSAYALSYSIQKIIESLEGGEKPAVGLYGHYHKLWAGNIRNVWCVQTGTTEDQTPFMRKKRLEAHVGGAIVELEQDPRTGAIIAMTPQLIRYFNRGYYNNRWSHSRPATLAPRDAV